MAGINMGRKYTLSHNYNENIKNEEGVCFSKRSGKWLVRIKNNTKSKYARPFVTVAQYDIKQDADNYFNKLKSNDEP